MKKISRRSFLAAFSSRIRCSDISSPDAFSAWILPIPMPALPIHPVSIVVRRQTATAGQ